MILAYSYLNAHQTRTPDTTAATGTSTTITPSVTGTIVIGGVRRVNATIGQTAPTLHPFDGSFGGLQYIYTADSAVQSTTAPFTISGTTTGQNPKLFGIAIAPNNKYLSVGDSTSINDATTIKTVSLVVVTDSTAVSDSGSLSVQNFAFSVSDSTAIGESNTVALLSAYSLLVTDQALVQENWVIFKNTQTPSVSDATVMGEAITMTPALAISPSDTTTMSDSCVLSPFTSWSPVAMNSTVWTDMQRD